MAKMVWLLYVFVGALCLEQGLAQSNLRLNGKSVQYINKRSVDEGPGDAVLEGISPVQKRAAVDEDVEGGRSIPHLRDILKRSTSNINKGPVSKRSAKEEPAHIVQKRDGGGGASQEEPGKFESKPFGGFTNALPHRRSVDDVLGNDDDGMPIPHIVQKRQTDEGEIAINDPYPTRPPRH